jgi:hypothetical protein
MKTSVTPPVGMMTCALYYLLRSETPSLRYSLHGTFDVEAG